MCPNIFWNVTEKLYLYIWKYVVLFLLFYIQAINMADADGDVTYEEIRQNLKK